MTTKTVIVTLPVEVTVDETKFTPEFMQEFRDSFYSFATLDDHIKHLGQLYVRGGISDFGRPFIEGYGPASELGISFTELDGDTEIE